MNNPDDAPGQAREQVAGYRMVPRCGVATPESAAAFADRGARLAAWLFDEWERERAERERDDQPTSEHPASPITPPTP